MTDYRPHIRIELDGTRVSQRPRLPLRFSKEGRLQEKLIVSRVTEIGTVAVEQEEWVDVDQEREEPIALPSGQPTPAALALGLDIFDGAAVAAASEDAQ